MFSDVLTENWDDPNAPVPSLVKPGTGEIFHGKGSDFKSVPCKSEYINSNWRNYGANKRGYNYNEWRRNNQNPGKFISNKTVMKVDYSKIGKIIGKQGSKIKELEKRTNTRIKVGDYCEEDNSLREVIISGNENSQKECQKLIEELVNHKPLKVKRETLDTSVPFIDWDAINALADKAESEKWAKCPPMKKNFYIEDPDVGKMTKEEVDTFRKENNNIVVKNIFGGDEEILNPVKTFQQAFKNYPIILKEIEKEGFENPSPIQCQAWPILLSGRDLIAVAQTGTGKTLAFLLPALIHIDGQEIPRAERGGANVLIIAPTRELALQIEKEVQKYSYKGIKSACLYGGSNRKEQVKVVTDGVQIIIATPGRLNDLISSDVVNLGSITFLVLDEADRMLDTGFEPQIRKTLLDIRPDRQSVMISATWPAKVQDLAERYMRNPVQVYIGSLDLAAVHSVTQTILVVKENEKMDYLLRFISTLSDEDKIIVFVSRKVVADSLSCDLSLERISCQCIHGKREQIDREQALEDIRTGAVKILVATDVASRGIDITDVTKVFNYDFPKNIEEYVHRVGRTGRAGKRGEAITLFTKADRAFAGELIGIMEEASQPVPEELYLMRDRHNSMLQNRQDDQKNNRAGNYARKGNKNDFVYC